MPLSTPHLDKLKATLENEKLPACDKECVERAMNKYKEWVAALDKVSGTPDEIIQRSVDLLNEYRLHIDIDLIFNSKDNFLYRQKGQLKLDNSVIEEFLPRLVQPSVIPELKGDGGELWSEVILRFSLLHLKPLDAPGWRRVKRA